MAEDGISRQEIGKAGLLELAREWHGSRVVAIVAKDDRYRPVGCLLLDVATGTVHGLLVEEQFRRKGVATALLHEAEAIASAHGLDRLRGSMHPENEAARALFARQGYFEMVEAEKRLE